MSTFVIGDIQGCAHELEQLIRHIEAIDPRSNLVFAGDMINRGPDSLGTLRMILALGERAAVALGNHDLHLLAAATGVRSPHRSDTIADILNAPDRDQLLDWLRRQPLALMRDGCLIVHAGVLPQWSAERTLQLAAEVETVLRGEHWMDFLHHMYGNQPDRWDDSLTGNDRLRCIVNALTRMRYCQVDGTMFFGEPKTEEEKAALVPWFELPDRVTANTTVAFGHWSMLGLMIRPNLLALDSGCVWGGKLSAVRLEDRLLVQVDCPEYQQPD